MELLMEGLMELWQEYFALVKTNKAPTVTDDSQVERWKKNCYIFYPLFGLPYYIFHKNHLQVCSSNLISNGRNSPLISLWHRKISIRLPASFSSLTETTCSILMVSPLSLRRSGWGVPFSSKCARTSMGVERIFMVGLLLYSYKKGGS